MALATNLNTNEVKDQAGSEVEFNRISMVDRKVIFAQVSEIPYLPHRLTISHQESGTAINARRRSLCRIDFTNTGADSVTDVVTSAYVVLDIPIGNAVSLNDAKKVLAELTSFLATLGTSTFLYDGTGNGAAALINGSL